MIEQVPFALSLASVWAYGRHPIGGPVVGVVTSVSFIAVGALGDLPVAAAAANVVFLGLHGHNLVNSYRKDTKRMSREIEKAGNLLRDVCHKASSDAGWWTDLSTGGHLIDAPRIVEQKLCLIHSEISEAMEGYRKNLQDDKLPHRKMIEVELADAVIRIADLAGAMGLDLGGAIAEKMAFNAVRPDHKVENRVKGGGKAF